MKVIADSSFLIALATIEALSLLPQIFSEVFIPEAIYDEVVIRGAGLPGAEEVARAAWIKLTAVKDIEKTETYRAERLGIGESEDLALAEELQGDVLLVDDERAWVVAQRKDIAYLRSTELMLEAHRRGILDTATAESKLMELGRKRWMSEAVLEVALTQLKNQMVGQARASGLHGREAETGARHLMASPALLLDKDVQVILAAILRGQGDDVALHGSIGPSPRPLPEGEGE